MKSKILLITVMILAIFLQMNSYAANDFEKAMLKAKKNLKEGMDQADVTKIVKARGQFERILQLKQDVWLVNYYLALADYGQSLKSSASKNKEDIKKFTESGIDMINKSIDENPAFADSFILLEFLNFNRWQYEQEKMQEIITASQSADADAKKLEPGNPRYLLVNGIAHFYTPEAFGGGVKIAIPELEKSMDLYKNRVEKKNYYPDWGNDLAMGYMALSLIKRNDDGDMAKAKTLIDDAGKLNPDSEFISKYVMKEYQDTNKK
ncbi:MAG: hypothetical protein ABIY50_05805 [Ignavibacteria bacterium]